MWRRFLLILLLLGCLFVSVANKEILLADSVYKSPDSCIVFVSTRSANIEKGKQILGHAISPDASLRFYNIYFKGGSVKIAPRRSLKEAMDNANVSLDFLLYTEGHGKTFSDNVERGINASRTYGVSSIMFDWPSTVPGYSVSKNFYVSIHNSKSVATQFHQLLLLLENYKKQNGINRVRHISMFFHSMGNYVLLTTLKKYGAKSYGPDLIDNVIFNAPCVPSRGHKKLIELMSFQKNIYVMYNSKDQTLRGATILLGEFLLGRKPIRLAKNANYFNLSPVARVAHNCFIGSSFLEAHPEVKDLYSDLFHSLPVNYNTLFIESSSGTTNRHFVF